MSFILDALTRAQALRGRKTAALAHATLSPPARVRRQRNLWRLGAALSLLGTGALAATLWIWQRPSSNAAATEPVWVSMPEADEPSGPASSPVPPLRPSTRVTQQSPAQQARAVQQAVTARFRPPTTLSQPLPLPGSLATGSSVVPPPPPAMVAVAPPPAAAPSRVVAEDLKPLSSLPHDLQAKIWRMKVTLHVYTPQPSTRYVMIDNRQLREGDELFDGVRLDEITETGVVLRHEHTRVLALAPAGR